MTSLRNRRSFSSPSLEALGPPPPIPTGKGSRSAADPPFSEYIDNTQQVPELILPEHYICGLEPIDIIDYELLLQRDADSVNRLLRSAADLGIFQIIGHGICSEGLKSTLIENQWVFEQLSLSYNGHYIYADHEELVWCHEIAEKPEFETIFGDKNLHIFRQNIKEVARKLEGIAEELAPIIARGAIFKQMKYSIQTRESTLVLHRYHQTTAIANQIPTITTNESGQISSKYPLRLHLLLEPGEFFSRAGDASFSFFTKRNTIIVTVGDNFEINAGEFKNAIENLNFKPELKECGPLFSIELQWSSSDFSSFDLSNSAAKKFTLADQILILILIFFLYKTCCFLFS